MKMPWITEYDLMAGVDRHNELCIPPTPPAPPAPSPMHNHVVFGMMHWIANGSQWKARNVYVENRLPCKHFHDISYFIPHIPIPLPGWVLLPAIIPLSGSKIALGSFTVHANNNPAGVWGPTLNCWSNFPRPSGFTIPTRCPTVFVGVTFLDLLKSAAYCGFDMLLSYLLNKAFDRWLKGPLEGLLGKIFSKVLGNVLAQELITAINQAISKVVTEVGKKLFSKVLKPIGEFIRDLVAHWFGRTNPGMQEKYIRVFEAEAPAAFAGYLYSTWGPEIRKTVAEVVAQEHPYFDQRVILEEPDPQGSYREFEQGIIIGLGSLIKDATRGLLSGDEWQKLITDRRAV